MWILCGLCNTLYFLCFVQYCAVCTSFSTVEERTMLFCNIADYSDMDTLCNTLSFLCFVQFFVLFVILCAMCYIENLKYIIKFKSCINITNTLSNCLQVTVYHSFIIVKGKYHLKLILIIAKWCND